MKIKSTPYRAKVCNDLTPEKKKEIVDILYVKDVKPSDSVKVDDYYYSAFGFSREQRNFWTNTFLVAVPLTVVGFGSAAWDWGKDGARFGFGNEDWFDKNSYTGGADKLGHMASL